MARLRSVGTRGRERWIGRSDGLVPLHRLSRRSAGTHRKRVLEVRDSDANRNRKRVVVTRRIGHRAPVPTTSPIVASISRWCRRQFPTTACLWSTTSRRSWGTRSSSTSALTTSTPPSERMRGCCVNGARSRTDTYLAGVSCGSVCRGRHGARTPWWPSSIRECLHLGVAAGAQAPPRTENGSLGARLAEAGPESRSEVVRHLQRRLASEIVAYTERQRAELQPRMAGKRIRAAPNALYSRTMMQPRSGRRQAPSSTSAA